MKLGETLVSLTLLSDMLDEVATALPRRMFTTPVATVGVGTFISGSGTGNWPVLIGESGLPSMFWMTLALFTPPTR